MNGNGTYRFRWRKRWLDQVEPVKARKSEMRVKRSLFERFQIRCDSFVDCFDVWARDFVLKLVILEGSLIRR